MDTKGQPYILEVNPLPLLDPDPAEAYRFCLPAAGITYTQMIERILYSAIGRLNLN